MKILENCVTGDMVPVGSYTKDWYNVHIHPTTFYRKYDEFLKGFKQVKGLYTDLDFGQFISIRFSDKNDLTEFHRMHHEYI